jgi:hypothetical protein
MTQIDSNIGTENELSDLSDYQTTDYRSEFSF